MLEALLESGLRGGTKLSYFGLKCQEKERSPTALLVLPSAPQCLLLGWGGPRDLILCAQCSAGHPAAGMWTFAAAYCGIKGHYVVRELEKRI